MGAVGIQIPEQNASSRGIKYVIVLKPAKIVSRHCVPGDIIEIEKSTGKIFPNEDGLTGDPQVGDTETLLNQLLRLGIVKPHQIQPGDKPISVSPRPGPVTAEAQGMKNIITSNPRRGAI